MNSYLQLKLILGMFSVNPSPITRSIYTMQLSTAGEHVDVPRQKNAYEGVMAISRRDTVIIAMLVNIALLFVLFATATKNYDDLENGVVTTPAIIEKIAPPVIDNTFTDIPQSVPVKSQTESLPIDEIDEILQQYAKKQQQMAQTKEIATPKPTIEPKKVDVSQAQAAKAFTEVKVKKGDSLAKIAKPYGVTVEQIIACNGLLNAKLQIGQVLKIPTNDKAVKKEKQKVAPIVQESIINETAAQYYVVKSGDNPWTIARRFHLKFEDLLKLNDLNEEKARNLKIGQKIRIR